MLNGFLWDFLVIFFVVVGLFYILIMGVVQVCLFLYSIKVMKLSCKECDDDYGIIFFQVFVIGFVSCVGVGNVVGVVIVIVIGGLGVVFWMWVIVFLGMSLVFVELFFVQLFKVCD